MTNVGTENETPVRSWRLSRKLRQNSLKRFFLYSLVVSVLFGAVLGIITVLRDHWGWFEARVILTTITVAVASVGGLACDLSRTPRGHNLLPKTGLVVTSLAALMFLAAIWTEMLDHEWYWKSASCVAIFAVATIHMCLLSIARLSGWFRWIYYGSWQIVFGLATLLAALLIWEIDHPRMWRFVVVLAIVDAAVSMIIPLLHRICRSSAPALELLSPLEARNLQAVDVEIAELKERLAKLEKLRGELMVAVTESPSP